MILTGVIVALFVTLLALIGWLLAKIHKCEKRMENSRMLGDSDDRDEMTIESSAMDHADDLVWQFQERLYDRAFEVAKSRGGDHVTVEDVKAARRELRKSDLSKEDWTAIGVARAALALTDQGACQQEIATLNRLIDNRMEAANNDPECGLVADAGLGTTLGMWEMLSELLEGEKLPESLSRAIHKLCEGEAKVVHLK